MLRRREVICYYQLIDNRYRPPKLLFETLQHRWPIYLIKSVDNTKIPLHSYIGIHVRRTVLFTFPMEKENFFICLFFPGAS